jgi:hypothetical protein
MDLATRTLTFDLAQWFTGDAATAAEREDGVTAEDDVASNDYDVRDNSHRLRTVPLAASFGHATNALDRQYHGNFLGYWLTVARGTVVRIDEQYTP